MVLPDEALTKNLLGVSFLSRLKRYEYANGRMVLETVGKDLRFLRELTWTERFAPLRR
jgi:hypothetical protein